MGNRMLETTERNQVAGCIRYTDYSELERLIAHCKHEQAKSVGYTEAMNDICERFGVQSVRELYELAEKTKTQKEAA